MEKATVKSESNAQIEAEDSEEKPASSIKASQHDDEVIPEEEDQPNSQIIDTTNPVSLAERRERRVQGSSVAYFNKIEEFYQ